MIDAYPIYTVMCFYLYVMMIYDLLIFIINMDTKYDIKYKVLSKVEEECVEALLDIPNINNQSTNKHKNSHLQYFQFLTYGWVIYPLPTFVNLAQM